MKFRIGDFKSTLREEKEPLIRLMLAAGVVFILDQLSKLLVEKMIPINSHSEILSGFFALVHWGNTGAAWSLFTGQNILLGWFGLLSLGFIYFFRRFLEFSHPLGQIGMGLMMGGITGNLVDRFFRGHVVDFLYFFIYTRSGKELGYPAFNIADIGICVGVGILFILGIFHIKKNVEQDG